MTRPAQHLLMALAFDVYWTLVVMLRERGLLIWLTLAIFAWLRLPAASRPPALLLAAAGCGLDACWALAGLIDFRGDSLLPLWMVAPVADVRRRLDPTDPHRDASRLGAGHGRHRRRPGGLPDRRSPRSHDPAGADGAWRGRHGLRLAGAHAVIPSGDGEAKMRFALLLLWLTTLAPAAHAADWLTWRRVGEATLTWGPFTIYHSQLRTPNGRYDGPQQDRALIITYRRDIDREALVEATRDQWQAQGILQQEPRSEAWLRMLQGIWPDVAPGSQLAFVVRGGEGQFWYRASAAQTAFTPLGPRQSAAFSTRFLAIWLDPRTTYPELRQQLIGGTP